MAEAVLPTTGQGLGERILRAYAPLLILWLAYYVGVQIALAPYDTPIVLVNDRFIPMYTLATCGFIGICVACGFVRYCANGNLPPAERWRKITAGIRWPEALGLGWIPPMAMVFTIMGIFKSFKPHIPDMNPFTWDPTFVAWDRALFLGSDGWEVTHALLPWPLATLLVDRLYLAWFLAVLAAVMVAGFSPLSSRTRLAFLMTFNLNWIVAGTIFAIMFSSVGPVFLDRLTGDQTYLPLLVKLHEAHDLYWLWTVSGIELLWSGYMKEPDVIEFGISAFPSLHVCMGMLVVLYVRNFGRIWAGLAWTFFVFILFGSVHLGWHYLVDGLAGMAICWANWRASLWFAGWWLRD